MLIKIENKSDSIVFEDVSFIDSCNYKIYFSKDYSIGISKKTVKRLSIVLDSRDIVYYENAEEM